MVESIEFGGQTLSRSSELENDPPGPFGKVSILVLRSELPQVIEKFIALSPENFTRHLVLQYRDGIILVESRKKLAEVPKLAASRCPDPVPHREALMVNISLEGTRYFIHHSC